jgi:hypothetical protein
LAPVRFLRPYLPLSSSAKACPLVAVGTVAVAVGLIFSSRDDLFGKSWSLDHASISPLVTLLLAYLFLDKLERVNRWILMGTIMAVSGGLVAVGSTL